MTGVNAQVSSTSRAHHLSVWLTARSEHVAHGRGGERLGGVGMSGIVRLAAGIEAELARRLPRQRETQRGKLALLVATMLSWRSANLTDLAAAVPRSAERVDMRHRWIARLPADPRLDCDAVMRPFAGEAIRHASAVGGAAPGPEQGLGPAPDAGAERAGGWTGPAPGVAGPGEARGPLLPPAGGGHPPGGGGGAAPRRG